MNTIERLEKRINRITPAIISLLVAIDEIKGTWKGSSQLHPQILGRLKQSVLITSTGASTRIEGAELADIDVEKLMKGLSVTLFKDRDKQEVQGYYELLETVFAASDTIHLTENSIKHLHRELLQYVEKDTYHRGEYKQIENKVQMVDAKGKIIGTVFNTTPMYLTPVQMRELVEWTENAFKKRTYHPLLIIGTFIVEFLKIHPFQDGNGRLSRILTNLLLLQNGYVYAQYVSHEKVIEQQKSEYYLALRKSQMTFNTEAEDSIDWLEFFLGVVLEQSRQALFLLSGKNTDDILSPKQALVWEFIQNKSEVSTGEIVENTGIARSTVNQALDRLLQYGKVARIGLGAGARYRVLK